MKRCPKCNQVYAEDDLNFCLTDGASLLTMNEPEPTLVLSPRLLVPLTSRSPSQSQQPSRPGVNPLFAYTVVGLLALIIGGGIVLWLKSDTNSSSSVTTQNTMPSIGNSTPRNSAEANPEPNGNHNQITPQERQPERSNPFPPPTKESIQNLMNRWENSQDTRDFTAYESCYAYSFSGVLRTTNGRVKVYGFNEWMRDRRKMINQIGGVDVDVSNMKIRIDGDTATVEFDQYYRSGSYRDWGPKVIKIKATTEGEKIVYEELKASYSL